ncbi:adenosylmethionine decarboxylase [Filobacillus milosensis]|uniref:S-adenosylmethionine decarboxylase proenzyme n=1 Tax=Filobacillus milosensis TaxID=94137 RepID=A0A4Y8IZN3_9BACI|nr:adenosylmethionine decarboxylase [Filobacillus milosensis]TFB25111.1 adenosylmethionine decarboxylase [Filobacillus milosensis]
MNYTTEGSHVFADFWGVDESLLNDGHSLKQWMQEGAELAGATVLSCAIETFKPQGVTIAVLLAESHFTIHTYPEKGFCALDCYTCGESTSPSKAIKWLENILQPSKVRYREIERGYAEEGEKVYGQS